jgi:hypothetical protein
MSPRAFRKVAFAPFTHQGRPVRFAVYVDPFPSTHQRMVVEVPFGLYLGTGIQEWQPDLSIRLEDALFTYLTLPSGSSA